MEYVYPFQQDIGNHLRIIANSNVSSRIDSIDLSGYVLVTIWCLLVTKQDLQNFKEYIFILFFI